MLASLLIVFREILEAGLIVGIVLAATEGVYRRGLWVTGGVAVGVLGAALVAGFASAISNSLQGMGQELFTVAILCVAVLMLSWHIIWMAKHGREMASEMKSAGAAVKGGDKSLLALAIVVAVAVLREGSEVVLFLYGIAVSSNEGPVPLLIGGVLGLGLGALLSYLLYRGLVIIPMRHLFSVTNWLVALLAAGMAGQAAAVLANLGLVPTWGEAVWNSSGILSEDSLVGRALHALIGYSERPFGVQVVAYVATLVVLVALSRLIAKPKAPVRAATRTSAPAAAE
ncbi:MAG TPA: FTR1 family protein [Aliidongia sp.]|uniref:FTR1 family iron permease n=1 Tax=Aliidongia sp. TaxID=1914230 RepID=UPI002DDD1927|nr:FTR1 family protein [Aliidongia sp.]HEV2677036.1 FTR1 family protein [Aliidongia sp.]